MVRFVILGILGSGLGAATMFVGVSSPSDLDIMATIKSFFVGGGIGSAAAGALNLMEDP